MIWNSSKFNLRYSPSQREYRCIALDLHHDLSFIIILSNFITVTRAPVTFSNANCHWLNYCKDNAFIIDEKTKFELIWTCACSVCTFLQVTSTWVLMRVNIITFYYYFYIDLIHNQISLWLLYIARCMDTRGRSNHVDHSITIRRSADVVLLHIILRLISSRIRLTRNKFQNCII